MSAGPANAFRFIVAVVLMLIVNVANSCSMGPVRAKYVNVVTLHGPPMRGLHWTIVYNALTFDGDDSLTVAGIRDGVQFPIAKWQDKLFCIYGETGLESCSSRTSDSGVRLGPWLEASNHIRDLTKFHQTLAIKLGTQPEVIYELRSNAMRTNRKLQMLFYGAAMSYCETVLEGP